MEFAPKHFNLFADFKQLAGHVTEGIALLDTALRAGETTPAQSMAGIQELRRAGDGIVRRVLRQLDRQLTDVVPQEDVFRTFVRMEKVLQALEGLAIRLAAFRLESFSPLALRLMDLIQDCNSVLQDIIEALGEGRHFAELVTQIDELANQRYAAFRDALATLFQTETDPVRLIQFNEVYGFLDRVVEMIEDCAKEIEDVALKHHW
jgi:uncharacterized protein Yka (UPF0111/DUF47 family)